MKRLTAILILAAMLLISLCGCGGDMAASSAEDSTVLSASTPPESIPGDESSADVPDKDEAFVILLRNGSFEIGNAGAGNGSGGGMEAGAHGTSASEFLNGLDYAYPGAKTNLDIIEMSPILDGIDVSYVAYSNQIDENSYTIDANDIKLHFRILSPGKKSVAADKALATDGKVVNKALDVREITIGTDSPAIEGIHYENVGKPITMQGIRESIATRDTQRYEGGTFPRTVWTLRKEGVDVYVSIRNHYVGVDNTAVISFYVYFAIGDSIIKVYSPAFNLGERKPVPYVPNSDGTYPAGDDSDLAWPTLESFADYGGELIYGLVDTSTESCELIRRIKAAYANARTVPKE